MKERDIYYKPTEKNLKRELLNQLKEKKLCNSIYIDQIEQYITLFKLAQKCKDDIEDKGLRYKTKNSKGDTIEKPNESCINLTKINTQMLKILSELDLKNPSSSGGGFNDLC